MKKEILEIRDLITELNEYTAAYNQGNPSISDKEWDELYFRLEELEKKTGILYPDSPTQGIQYSVVNELKKVKHNHLMLSLAKTKDIAEIGKFLDNKPFIAMSKMDGLTCSLRYINGELVSAETRGNGEVGEDVLHNVLVLPSVPKTIPYQEELVVDGEIICDLNTFSAFFAEQYKNPRNFAAGGIRLLDSKESARRFLTFVAWEVIEGFNDIKHLNEKLNKLDELGFKTVPRMYSEVFDDTAFITGITAMSQASAYPIDGLVFKFDDIEYGKSLGNTDHHFNNAMAFKFYDEAYETKLIKIEWTMGRTGQLTPVAVFEPVNDGESTFERASLHNMSVMQETLHGNGFAGQKIYVAKMNQIIPQIVEAEEIENQETFEVPTECPFCGHGTVIMISDSGIKTLSCGNQQCQSLLINRLDHFAGKKGLDIVGLSKATLEKLIDWGWVNSLVDIFKLEEYKTEWMQKSGFGTASVNKILTAIENSKTTTLDKFISSLGIPLIGTRMAKLIVAQVSNYQEFRDLIINRFDFSQWEGFADSKTEYLLNFDYTEADKLYQYMKIETNKPVESKKIDLTVCITGGLEQYKNRAEMQAAIEAAGGKVVSSISKKVNYLINNDLTSGSSKNLKAKELNIPIISEADFIQKFLK